MLYTITEIPFETTNMAFCMLQSHQCANGDQPSWKRIPYSSLGGLGLRSGRYHGGNGIPVLGTYPTLIILSLWPSGRRCDSQSVIVRLLFFRY